MQLKYFVFGTNDMPRAVAFYDALFAGSDIGKLHDEGRMTLWSDGDFMFALAEPFDQQPANRGNGSMAGFNVSSPAEVDRLHALALRLGGEDEGPPGIRSGRYAAYARDLDGNKLCFFE